MEIQLQPIQIQKKYQQEPLPSVYINNPLTYQVLSSNEDVDKHSTSIQVGQLTEPNYNGKRKHYYEGETIKHSKIPSIFRCDHCNYYGFSKIEFVRGDFFWWMFVFLMIVLCPFSWTIVFCKWPKDVRHICPHCKRSVGYEKVLECD